MSISIETKNGVIHVRDGEKLIKIMPESIGSQIKLTAQNGVTQTDAQKELEAIHTNIDGAVTGPASSTGDNLAAFDGATGKVVKDTGISSASVQAAIDFSGKVPSKVADSVPDSMPEDLMPGGLLFVTTPSA